MENELNYRRSKWAKLMDRRAIDADIFGPVGFRLCNWAIYPAHFITECRTSMLQHVECRKLIAFTRCSSLIKLISHDYLIFIFSNFNSFALNLCLDVCVCFNRKFIMMSALMHKLQDNVYFTRYFFPNCRWFSSTRVSVYVSLIMKSIKCLSKWTVR